MATVCNHVGQQKKSKSNRSTIPFNKDIACSVFRIVYLYFLYVQYFMLFWLALHCCFWYTKAKSSVRTQGAVQVLKSLILDQLEKPIEMQS